MGEILHKARKQMRPPGGWAALALLAGALLSAVTALAATDLRIDAVALSILTSVALITGLLAARTRLSALASFSLFGLVGLVLLIVITGKLTPPFFFVLSDAAQAIDWAGQWQKGVIGWPLPFGPTAEYVGQRLYELGLRLWWWSQAASTGGPAQDNILLLLVTGALAWISSFFAAWQVYRRRAALVGLLPAGLAVTTAAFFATGMALFYLVVFIFCTLWLVAICNLWTRMDRWDQAGTDYPGDMGQELLITLGPWLLLLVAVAGIFPSITPRQISEAFWKVAEEPWSAVEDLAERAFGPVETGYTGGPGGGAGEGGLPRAHLLGAGPELTERLVMRVKTSDPPPPLPDPEAPNQPLDTGPRRYWRGITYDVYNGRGWQNSALESRPSAPDSPLAPEMGGLSPGQGVGRGDELVQNFGLVAGDEPEAGTGRLLYAANEPLRLDSEAEAWWRGPADLVRLTGDTSRYTVVSSPLEPTVADLRAAPATIPPAIAERYLALPESLPQRVLDLTVEVVGETGTTYDQARAIEAFLRTYTYTLDLPTPPTDRDLVDYFLFERQEGYCDYYASSMVVMARAAGIPARLASGYAQGTYDHEAKNWEVQEKNGHSWVEVYFDGFGWVEFEPTAGLPVLNRPGGEAASSVPPLPPRAPAPTFPWALLALGGLLVLALAAIAFVWLRQPSAETLASASELVRDRQRRLQHWGERLGYPLRDGQTPAEYGDSLSAGVRDLGRGARWSRVQQAGEDAPTEVESLTGAFVQVQYSPEPVSPREGARVSEMWTRLRGRLWWLWLGRSRRQPATGQDTEGDQREPPE